MTPLEISLADARRIALAAQGFNQPRPLSANADDIRRVVRQLALVQIDCVNVLTPAHYQVLFSRLGRYDTKVFDELIYDRREFTEQWAHEASIVPMETWPLLDYRRRIHRVRPYGFEVFMAEHSEYVAAVLDEVRKRGPLMPSDLPHPEGTERRLAQSWFGTVTRAVLEAHFGRGDIAIARRLPNFARVYDAAERIIPTKYREISVPRADAERQLIAIAARALGISTAADLADYFRMPVRDTTRPIAELVASGDLLEARVEGWRTPAYLHRDAAISNATAAAALLSPFDPLIWYRPRLQRLFAFEHRFEIFVPQNKRKWGVYVLPFLLVDRLVARVDLRADRENGHLLVLAAYAEDSEDCAIVADALAAELRTLAGWLGLGAIRVGRRGNLARLLAASLRSGCDKTVRSGCMSKGTGL
jgi:uncharacterized protein